jgi:hypothetical protein
MNKQTKQSWPSTKAPLPFVKVPWYPIKPMSKLKEASEIIQSNWSEVKSKLNQRWVDFTDRDIALLVGKAEDLCLLLQQKYLYTKERAEEELNNFLKEHGWKKKR